MTAAPASLHEATAFRLYHRVDRAWEAVLADLGGARETIDFEQYIVGDDTIGHRLLRLLADKARKGVRVRVLLDAVGSSDLMRSGAGQGLREAGGDLRFYNPLAARALAAAPTRVHRDHRKTVLIDGRIAYTGGICFEDRMSNWRDTMLRLEPEHTALRAMAEVFEMSWDRAEHPAAKRRMPRGDPDRRLYRQQAGPFRYLVNSPERPICRELSQCLFETVEQARRSLRLTTPYFIPEHRLLRRLVAARRRGVEVRLLLPGISDHPPLDILSRAFAERLCDVGCEVAYFPDRMMHAKIIVADDAWASVSSLNLDRMSSRLNLENGLASDDPAFVSALAERFDDDVATSPKEPPEPTPWHPLVDPVLRAAGRLL